MKGEGEDGRVPVKGGKGRCAVDTGKGEWEDGSAHVKGEGEDENAHVKGGGGRWECTRERGKGRCAVD